MPWPQWSLLRKSPKHAAPHETLDKDKRSGDGPSQIHGTAGENTAAQRSVGCGVFRVLAHGRGKPSHPRTRTRSRSAVRRGDREHEVTDDRHAAGAIGVGDAGGGANTRDDRGLRQVDPEDRDLGAQARRNRPRQEQALGSRLEAVQTQTSGGVARPTNLVDLDRHRRADRDQAGLIERRAGSLRPRRRTPRTADRARSGRASSSPPGPTGCCSRGSRPGSGLAASR